MLALCRLLAVVALWAATLAAANGEMRLRVTTWNLEDRAGERGPSRGARARALAEAADALRNAGPDVGLLQGIHSEAEARQVAAGMGADFRVNVCSAFPDGANGASPRNQVAILSTMDAFSARVEGWMSGGGGGALSGFAFAAFREGTNVLCLYSAHLPGRGRPGTAGTEEAITHLIRHAAWVEEKLPNLSLSFVVGGGFPAEIGGVHARWSRLFVEHGFVDMGSRAASGAGLEGQVIGVPVFLGRGVRVEGAVAAGPAAPFFHGALAAEVRTVGASNETEGVSGMARVLAMVWTQVASVRGLLVAGGGIGVWVLWRVAVRIRRRRQPWQSVDFRNFGGRQTYFGGAGGAKAPAMVVTGESKGWQQRALVAEDQAQEAKALVRAGLLPQLAQLMRDKVFRALVSQRATLLETQQTGVAQLNEMEQRLRRVQSQFEERLKAYEERIAELEGEVAMKDRETRNLLGEKLELSERLLGALKEREQSFPRL
ncbi:MAG TPA: hypothetical protein VMS21_15005 [Methylomirabilota bacterium]|nr:hypothetical protein [Methylomirabilota bacterium]